jgi:hypothetical protein
MKKIIFFTIILIFTLKAQPLVTVNDITCAFSEGSEKSSIEENIVEGSIHFLQSKSSADLLLCEIEKSANREFNYSLSIEYVEKAISELEISRASYINAIEIGKRIGYIKEKVDWFKFFDYDSFIKDNNLNGELALKVKYYLFRGDVIGIYQQNIDNITNILNTLYLIKDQIKSNRVPDKTAFWKLFQQYAETALFGNYSTIIGSTILENCGGGGDYKN